MKTLYNYVADEQDTNELSKNDISYEDPKMSRLYSLGGNEFCVGYQEIF